MTGEVNQPETEQPQVSEAAAGEPSPEQMPAIESRFLFVDVASRRAKQLRKGALPRLKALRPDPETGERPIPGSKLERIAMAEVAGGLIVYELPAPTNPAQSVS